MSDVPGQFNHSDYTVGWICALPKTELVAAGAMLDEEHPVLPAADSNDTNAYILGRIGHHNVVIACLPAETKGKVSAATVAKDMLRSFPAVRFGLMVGMGGWVPYYGSQGNGMESDGLEEDSANESDDEQDIRLGDVVVSLHSKSTEAVVQYDFGKSVQGKEFIRIGGRLNKPYDATLRDKLVQKEKIKCFEMEAAGLMDLLPCLIIRGICNYADSHSNKIWQPYAAATAASYAKELLLIILATLSWLDTRLSNV